MRLIKISDLVKRVDDNEVLLGGIKRSKLKNHKITMDTLVRLSCPEIAKVDALATMKRMHRYNNFRFKPRQATDNLQSTDFILHYFLN